VAKLEERWLAKLEGRWVAKLPRDGWLSFREMDGEGSERTVAKFKRGEWLS